MQRGKLVRKTTRRQFLAVTGVFVAGAMAGCGGGGGGGGSKQGQATTRTVFRLSGRGRRISKAAKVHNANFLFATQRTADKHRAHPGDNSRIVPLVISSVEFDKLFKKKKVVDLRHKP